MSLHPHVLVFDSGVGGLSVAREILTAYPQCRLTYASDNAQFPYGNKPPEVLLERVHKVINQLIQMDHPDVVVIACNTASTITLPRLRENFNVPFVGVVPAVKPAAGISRTKVIGLLATPATVSRPYTLQLIRDYAAHCRVQLHGSHALVAQAENKLQGHGLDTAAIAHELTCLIGGRRSENMDTIVLACTHFPLLIDELDTAARAMDRQFQWVDSGEAIARRVGYWIGQLPLADTAYKGPHQVRLTAQSTSWQALGKQLPLYLGAGPPAELKVFVVD